LGHAYRACTGARGVMVAMNRKTVCVERPAFLVERIAKRQNRDGSEIISDTTRHHLRECMKQGYREMGPLNLALAEEGPAFEAIPAYTAWPLVGGE
jgi:hypothetical protein